MDRQALLGSAATLAALAACVAIGLSGVSKVNPDLLVALPRPTPQHGLEYCMRNAELLHDISWAAACYSMREDNECTLPDARAALINATYAADEARCRADHR